MRTIEFTKDFAGRKAGSSFTCDGSLASQLVRIDKVAKFTDVKKKPKAKTKK